MTNWGSFGLFEHLNDCCPSLKFDSTTLQRLVQTSIFFIHVMFQKFLLLTRLTCVHLLCWDLNKFLSL